MYAVYVGWMKVLNLLDLELQAVCELLDAGALLATEPLFIPTCQYFIFRRS